MRPPIVFCVIVGVACVVASAASLFLASSYPDFSSVLGVCSTVSSVVLAIASMVYSYMASKSTEETLSKIVENNSALVDKIRAEEVQKNINAKSAQSVRERTKRRVTEAKAARGDSAEKDN